MLLLENLNPASKIETPKDFRPALEFDGENGFAITPGIPAGEVPNFEQFLLEQGFDPDLYEIVGNPRTSRWQKYDESWLTSYRFNFRLKAPDRDLTLIWKTAKQGIKKSKEKSLPSNKALVVMLADFQLGKTDNRGGLQEQLERIFVAYSAVEQQVKRGKYDQVILAEMGDIIEGFYNKASMQQTFTNSISQMQQVDLAITLIWELVKRVAQHATVTYASVASNHCQFRLSGQQVGSPGQDDWGIMIAKQIKRLSDETELNVKVLIPQPQDESLALDVFDDSFHILGLWHGHQSNRPDGVPTWWEKQAFGQQPVAAATIGLTGHFHHLRVQELGQSQNGGSRYWIQGKTMDNGSSWFRLNQGSDSAPGLTCFELIQGKHFTGNVFTLS
jgi:hypothetical protein